MSPSPRDGAGSGEPGAQSEEAPLRYIAQMPSPRRQPPAAPRAAGSDGAPPPPPVPTPQDERPRGGRNGWLAPLAVILISLGALAAVFFLTQSGGDSQAAPTSPTEQASSTPTTESTPDASSSAPAPSPSSTPSTSSQSSTSSSSSTSATLPAGVKVCGPGVGAGATTTCGFAENVATAVRSAGKDSGTFTVAAWSPTTKKDYTLRCTASGLTVCTGGRAAVIYVTS